MFFSLVIIFNSDYLKVRYGNQLFSQIIDKDKKKNILKVIYILNFINQDMQSLRIIQYLVLEIKIIEW